MQNRLVSILTTRFRGLPSLTSVESYDNGSAIMFGPDPEICTANLC